MPHPLETIINEASGFLLVGESGAGRFPALSYHAYDLARKTFYCHDLDGLAEARGKSAGGKVYASVDELPEDRGDLAIIWVTPKTATRAVDVAHEAGCRRVWFSFKSGHRDAVARARELGLEVVEIGRCPVYYLSEKPAVCKTHTLMVKLSGNYRRPPQTDSDKKRRELF